MKIKAFAVTSQNEHDEIVFVSKVEAIEYMESVTGKKQNEWGYDEGDYVEGTDDMIWINEVEIRLPENGRWQFTNIGQIKKEKGAKAPFSMRRQHGASALSKEYTRT